MATRIGISGFGAIGRRVARVILAGRAGVELVAVNDLPPAASLAHLFKYDTTYGTFEGGVEAEGEDALIIAGQRLRLFHIADPAQIPWKDAGVDVVLECTGHFTDREGAAKHLAAGARKVIISAPGKDADATLVMGVNERDYDPAKHDVISNGSCTTNCLVPVVKVLEDTFGIEALLMSTTHAYTGTEPLLDRAGGKDPRKARAAAQNIIPTTTGAAKAVFEVFPHMKGRVTGLALRVPVHSVSILDVSVQLKGAATAGELNEAFRKAAAGPLMGILDVCDEPLVSSDFRGSAFSAIVDAGLTQTAGALAKVMAWYDNEWGYSNRLAEMAAFVGRHLS